jgi:hypothetical protein
VVFLCHRNAVAESHSERQGTTSEKLCDALYRFGSEDGTADKIPPAVIAKLIEFKMVELSATGLPQLTPYGEKCYIVMESGDGVVPELKDLAAMEDQQRQ